MLYDDYWFRVGSDDFILVRYVKGRGLFHMTDSGFKIIDSSYRYSDSRYCRCSVLRRLLFNGYFDLLWLETRCYSFDYLKTQGRFFRDCYERF